MDLNITAEEVRIIGALMEKEVTTPDYYPMTLNSLVAACNQKSCREPVTSFDEATVSFHLDILRDTKKLAGMVSAAGSRVQKFKQRLTENYFFTPPERAVLCELMLRGPQTPGELRNRAERMHPFASIDEVLGALRELETRVDGPWVVLLPRMAGHKEARYAHLLSGRPEMAVNTAVEPSTDAVSAASPIDRISRLEIETRELRDEVARLSADFKALRDQLGS